MAEPCYWYSAAKMKLCVEKITKTVCFYLFLQLQAQFLLYCTNKIVLPSWKTNKTLWFYWFLKLKPSFLLYCTKKNNHFMQKCCTVPKKPKKTMFLDQWPWILVPASLASGQWSRNICFFCFFWHSTALLVEMIGFFGTVQQKLRFELQKSIKP